jgi:transposase InsO family protein
METKPSKGETRNRRDNLTPGDVVSVDQIESSIPGLLAQITGSLTRKRIVGLSVYVDHGSDLSYIYHHTSMSSKETLKGKESFEQFARTHGVHIKHYHADNGRFKDNLFIKAIERNNKTISFSGVGAHHQNGIAEKRIGDLQRRATALLLHAERRWPDAINSHLWPYAMRAANDSRNSFPNKNSLECPISKFTRSSKVPKLGNLHHFGCPVYVLKKEIQYGKKAKKWTDRTRIGIHLGIHQGMHRMSP